MLRSSRDKICGYPGRVSEGGKYFFVASEKDTCNFLWFLKRGTRTSRFIKKGNKGLLGLKNPENPAEVPHKFPPPLGLTNPCLHDFSYSSSNSELRVADAYV